MSDDSNASTAPLDPGRVVPMDPDDLKYWCTALHCTEDELKLGIAAVGDHVAALREHLAGRRRGAAGPG